MCHNIKLSVDLRLFVRISVWPQRRAAGNPRDNGQLLVSSLSSNSPSKCHILLPHPSPGLACFSVCSDFYSDKWRGLGTGRGPGTGNWQELIKWETEGIKDNQQNNNFTENHRWASDPDDQFSISCTRRNFLTIINKRSPRNQPLQRQTIALSLNLLQHLSFHFSPKLNSRFLILHN